MDDCLIVGAGVIGLSIAYELSTHGARVSVVDRREAGREASWAGAGILPPARFDRQDHALDQLRGLSFQLHGQWASRLLEETKIDTGYRQCGGVYVARRPGEAACLRGMVDQLRIEGIQVRSLEHQDLGEIEPSLSAYAETRDVREAFFLPEESQLRNPWHLQALKAACCARGVEFHETVEVDGFEVQGQRISHLSTNRGAMRAEQYCIASGAWTGRLLKHLGIASGVMPIRGQMVLFRTRPTAITRIVNEGPRYIVPRDDGRVLAGSTEEEVGFDSNTTSVGIDDLRDWATTLIPLLKEAEVEKTWAGLRPGSFDGFPYIGKLPRLNNAFVAAGHFRSGLFLAPATAVVMSQLMRGNLPEIDLYPFRIGRG